MWGTLTDTPPEKMAGAGERYILRTGVQRVAANRDEHFLHPDPDESLPSVPRVRRALERAYQPACSAQRAQVSTTVSSKRLQSRKYAPVNG